MLPSLSCLTDEERNEYQKTHLSQKICSDIVDNFTSTVSFGCFLLEIVMFFYFLQETRAGNYSETVDATSISDEILPQESCMSIDDNSSSMVFSFG